MSDKQSLCISCIFIEKCPLVESIYNSFNKLQTEAMMTVGANVGFGSFVNYCKTYVHAIEDDNSDEEEE